MAQVAEKAGYRFGHYWPEPLAAPERKPSGPLFEPTPWVAQAACRGDTGRMFPDPRDAEAVALAVRVCATCDVVAACAAYAQGRGERYGVWGGRLLERAKRPRRSNAAPAVIKPAWKQPIIVERPTLPLEWPAPRRARLVPCPYCGIVFRTLGSHLLHRHGVRRQAAA